MPSRSETDKKIILDNQNTHARPSHVGAMASGVAHEFNNLMTVVLGSLFQLERDLPADGRPRQRLDRAKWAAGQAGRLTQQMLSFARRQFHDNHELEQFAFIANHGASPTRA